MNSSSLGPQGPASATDDKEARKQRLKAIYERAVQEHENTLRRVERNYKINIWVSRFATIITPLSLLVTIPAVLKGKSSWLIKGLFLLAGLVPLLSGTISSVGAKIIKVSNTPQPVIVKKVFVGTPEEVKAAHKEKRRQFKVANPAVPWEKLKGLEVDAEDKTDERVPASIPKRRGDSYTTRGVDGKFSQEAVDVYDANETVAQGQTKPSKIFIAHDEPGSAPKTILLQDREQAKRWDFIEGNALHTIYEYSSSEGITHFFRHSKIGSAHIVAELEKRYAGTPAAKV